MRRACTEASWRNDCCKYSIGDQYHVLWNIPELRHVCGILTRLIVEVHVEMHAMHCLHTHILSKTSIARCDAASPCRSRPHQQGGGGRDQPGSTEAAGTEEAASTGKLATPAPTVALHRLAVALGTSQPLRRGPSWSRRQPPLSQHMSACPAALCFDSRRHRAFLLFRRTPLLPLADPPVAAHTYHPRHLFLPPPHHPPAPPTASAPRTPWTPA